MAITNAIYDAVPCTQENLARMFASYLGSGYISGYGSELEIVPADPAGMKIIVSDGRARVKGYWYIEDDEYELPISENTTGSTRYDRVIVRLEETSPGQLSPRILEGTAGSGLPALATDGTEISLASIVIVSGESTITASEITSERDDPSLCGIAGQKPFKFSAIESPTTDIDLNGYTAINLDTPTSDTDGVTKAYFETKLVGGYFGTNRGQAFPWPFSTIPTGYLEWNGQSLLRASYPELFAAYGTTYGAADGTHFNLPKRAGKVAMGATTGFGTSVGAKTVALTASTMPPHAHPYGGNTIPLLAVTYGLPYYATITATSTGATGTTGSSTAHNNLQPYITLKWIVWGS